MTICEVIRERQIGILMNFQKSVLQIGSGRQYEFYKESSDLVTSFNQMLGECNVKLLCDRRRRQIFSDEFLYDNDSKRV